MNSEQLLEFHQEYLEEIKERGAQDGKMNQPHFEDTILSPYEKKIKANYKHQGAILKSSYADRIANVSVEKEEALKAELKALNGKDYQDIIKAEEIKMNEDVLKDKNRNAAEMKNLENTPSLVAARETQKRVNNEFKRRSKKLGRSYTDKVLPTWAYFIIMGAIAIGEIAFNFNAFIGLGDNKFFGMISAVGVNFGLVVIFHVIGDFIKRKREIKNGLVTAFGLIVICLGVIAGMAYLRDGHFELFIAIGILLMAVGIAMSWLNHDSNREFSNLIKDKDVVNKTLEKEIVNVNKLKDIENNRWKSETLKLKEDFRLFAENIDSITQTKQKEIDSLIVSRNSLREEYKERLNEVNTLYEVAVQSYREENYAYRNDTKQVIVWEKELEPLKI